MEIYGDLLRFLIKFTNDKTTINLISICKLVRNCCMKTYADKVFNHINYDVYLKMQPNLKCYVLKLKEVDKCRRLPSRLTHLKFSDGFNQKIIHYLPLNVRHITFGYSFNKSIDFLPKKLISLKLGYSFNKPIDHLPPNLLYLKLGQSFNQPIVNLPSRLKYLDLNSRFNHSIDNLPLGLLCLKLGNRFDQPINFLPPLLRCLFLSNYHYIINHTSNIYFIIDCAICGKSHCRKIINGHQYDPNA